MKCKNCYTELKPEDKYCCQCGAKVIKERITSRYLIAGLIASFGWDNRFFLTVKDLIKRPQYVIDGYLRGTRKKHTSPFTFFAIITTISVVVYSLYFNELIEMSTEVAAFGQTEIISETSPADNNIDLNQPNEAELLKLQFIKKLLTFIYEHYYYSSFILLPFYALMAFFVFGKQNNYAEHLVINTYIQGQIAIFGLFLFLLTLLSHNTTIYFWGTYLLTFIYYSYVYKQYRNYNFRQLVLRILRFFLILLILLFIMFLVGIVIGILMAVLKN